ncbi:MAG: 50S ribosomal protein L11 methyltransferase [Spartobacteria bacterium]|nr:50S ribosomal protein L11 methyltransferase [Spartobacteria bacterium]
MTDTWYIVTVQPGSYDLDELADWFRKAAGHEPVEVSRPKGGGAWIEVYFERDIEAQICARALDLAFPGIVRAVRSCREKDWQTFWRAHFKRRQVGAALELIPVWDERPEAAPDRHAILIDPGLSFGTGDHFTTRFCLEMLDELFARQVPESMLDVGTGSGILSIAAAKLGCPRVDAVDNDEYSLAQAAENLKLNRVDTVVTLAPHDITQGPPEGVYPFVCANIYGKLLIRVAHHLVATCRGYLVLSGILQREEEQVAQAFLAQGGREIVRDGGGEWTGLVFDFKS